MRYNKLNSGVVISEIGFGCWAIGGHGYGVTNDSESIDTIRFAIDSGINFFDTADVYGFGHSERLLGVATKDCRDKIVIATKFGVAWDASGRTYRDCSLKYTKHALEASLNRLGTDYIDIYQIHWPTDDCDIYPTIEYLVDAQNQGKIRHLGLSNYSLDQLSSLVTKDKFSTMQSRFSPFNQHNIDVCMSLKQMGLNVIGYGLLERGLLVGNYGLDTKFGNLDTRNRLVNESYMYYQEVIDAASKIRSIISDTSYTPAQLVIAYALSKKIFDTGIVGIKSIKQCRDILSSIELNVRDFQAELDTIIINQNTSPSPNHQS